MKLDGMKENLIMPDDCFPILVIQSEHVKDGFFVPSHWHEHIELVIIKRGVMEVRCDRKIFKASEGKVVFINPNEIHSYEMLSEEVTYECIIFDITLINSNFMDPCQQKYISPIRDNRIVFNNLIEDKIIIGYAEQLIKEYAEKMCGYEMSVKAILYMLIARMLKLGLYRIAIEDKGNMPSSAGKLKVILDFIEENLSEKLSLEKLSDMMKVTPFHFCHIFKEYTGQTLVDYINSLRINKAELMILSNSSSITDIAYSCGFNDTSYFSKLYKRYKKVSPSKAKL